MKSLEQFMTEDSEFLDEVRYPGQMSPEEMIAKAKKLKKELDRFTKEFRTKNAKPVQSDKTRLINLLRLA